MAIISMHPTQSLHFLSPFAFKGVGCKWICFKVSLSFLMNLPFCERPWEWPCTVHVVFPWCVFMCVSEGWDTLVEAEDSLGLFVLVFSLLTNDLPGTLLSLLFYHKYAAIRNVCTISGLCVGLGIWIQVSRLNLSTPEMISAFILWLLKEKKIIYNLGHLMSYAVTITLLICFILWQAFAHKETTTIINFLKCTSTSLSIFRDFFKKIKILSSLPQTQIYHLKWSLHLFSVQGILEFQSLSWSQKLEARWHVWATD